MKKPLLKIAALMVTLAPMTVLGRAREPLLVTGPDCPAGSRRAAPWVLYEDTNGDGVYDFVTAGGCNGQVSAYPWIPGSAQPDPSNPSGGGVIIGSLPPGAVHLVPTLTYREQPSGLYIWTIVEHASATDPEVCHIQRDGEMTLSMTCPSPDDGNFH